MGAEQFITTIEGVSAIRAFELAVANAQYDEGHSGYTGTIAEMTEFVMIEKPAEISASEYAEYCCMNSPEIEDKWGPCGCFALGEGNYMFFGWASS